MICKEDISIWFKGLESYKRIDVMCSLLNQCLPFELRFLGTCLEELGRINFQELRAIEVRVHNTQDLALEISLWQNAEPTDMKIRRTMVLYLALMRAWNMDRTCVNELFKTLDYWGDRDFHKMNDVDTLKELLLVYSLATNHPLFSFEQRIKCGNILLRIQENELVNEQSQQQQQQMHQQMHHHQQQIHQNLLNQNHQQQQNIHKQLHSVQSIPIHATAAHLLPQGTMQIGFTQAQLHQPISTVDGNMQHQMPVEGMPHIPPGGIPPEFAATAVAGIPNIQWGLRPVTITNMQNTETQQQQTHQPQSSSPMLSQSSSPSHSRTTSPNRSTANLMQQQQQGSQLRNQRVSLRNNRRPSNETTPPPQQQPNSIPHLMNIIGSSDLIMQQQQNMKNFEDVIINSDGSITQFNRNGYARSGHHTMPRPSKSTMHLPQHQLQQQQQQHVQTFISAGGNGPQSLPPNFSVPANLTYALHNMNLIDHNNQIIEHNNLAQSARENSINSRISKSNTNSGGGGNSDSGSSIGSTGDISPPETPTTRHDQHANSYRSRVNGRQDKLLNNIMGNTTTASILYAAAPPQPTTSPQQFQHILGNELLIAGGQIVQTSTINNNSPNTTNLTTAAGYHSFQQQQRPPQILAHNPAAGTGIQFRHPSFPNCDIMYPYPPQLAYPYPAQLQGPPPQPSPAAQQTQQTIPLRSSPSMQPPVVTMSQQPGTGLVQPIPLQPTPTAMLAASPYAVTVGGKQSVSCFNCGSQTHTGGECLEASMEEVTRSSIYKLDYSATNQLTSPTSSGIGGSNSSQNSSNSSSSSNSSGNVSNSSSNSNNNNNSNNSIGQQIIKSSEQPQQQNIENPSSVNSSNSSLSNQK